MSCPLLLPLLNLLHTHKQPFTSSIKIFISYIYSASPSLTSHQSTIHFAPPMLFFLISCFSFLFLLKSSMKRDLSLLLRPHWFWDTLSAFLVSWFQRGRLAIRLCYHLLFPMKIPALKNKMTSGSKTQEVTVKDDDGEEKDVISLLDLPDLALECILERLSPSGLCSMAAVCRSLRDMCTSDHLWKKHLELKWGRVIGAAAYREWHWHTASSRNRPRILYRENRKSFLRSIISSTVWPFSWTKPNFESRGGKPTSSLAPNSVMALYLALESGNFWFPAQVYNRENGHVGFLLSCYDAELSYDSKAGTFQARYSPFGRRTIEQNIHWDRLRAAPVDTPPHVLHISDCLNDLKPGDHVEIQWRRSKEFPYGWWYAVVGHLEWCEGSENHCCCQYQDMVMLEFNQYPTGSRWRRTIINRKEHQEEGNEADGFYGGIRKVNNEREISMWKRLWPKQPFE